MKNFDTTLVELFENFKIDKPSVAKNLEHLYSDYIELITLFSNYCFVTGNDVIDRLKDEGEIRKLENQDVKTYSEQNDDNEVWMNSLFQILAERSLLYGDDYPFETWANKIILKKELTSKNLLYIFLLISSNLDLFKKVKSELTSDFETISFYALKNYLPQNAIVKQFGKRSDYNGNAINKIRALANDLKVEVREHEIENISERNNQERGLDVVGWLPFQDNCPNIITILGQCACGKEWYSKHHDTKRYSHYLKFYRIKPYHAIFIPYALVGKNGNRFYRSDDIEDNTIVFERKRIIELFNNDSVFFDLESSKIVDHCVKYSEDIV